MLSYYLYKDGTKSGPLSIAELRQSMINPETLIWREGSSDWVEAKVLPELKDYFKTLPPPIPNEKIGYDGQGKRISDYSKVEDTAGVEYSYAMVVTGLYITLNTIAYNFPTEFLWVLMTTSLSVLSWYYFRKYFDAANDLNTSKWINYVIGANIIFGVVNLFVYTRSSASDIAMKGMQDGVESLTLVIFATVMATLVACGIVFVSGFKIISANKYHPFPLNRIAVSMMILVPIYMVSTLWSNFSATSEISNVASLMYYGESIEEESPNIISSIVLMLPYILLFHHFYRADRDDRTV